MHKSVFLAAIFVVAQAQAENQPRCGTDAFGNTVCMDKDGVLRTTPQAPAIHRDKAGAASAVSVGRAGDSGEEREVRRRCGVDPFGNTVCREW
jgi:hypothetical protein